MIMDKVNLIRSADISDLKNQKFLEQFICDLGLFPSSNTAKSQFPKELEQYFNAGLRIWKYPNQLSKLVIKLLEYPISSYLEIGHAKCGTLIFIHEFLNRFMKVSSIGVDICQIDSELTTYFKVTDNINRACVSSGSLFKKVDINSFFDLVLIDADHTYKSIERDYKLICDKSNIVIFHDIVNQHCSGAIKYWNDFKTKYCDEYDIFEFIDQYDEVLKRTKKTYLGIGLAVKKGVFDV
jgi:hypothetical protein